MDDKIDQIIFAKSYKKMKRMKLIVQFSNFGEKNLSVTNQKNQNTLNCNLDELIARTKKNGDECFFFFKTKQLVSKDKHFFIAVNFLLSTKILLISFKIQSLVQINLKLKRKHVGNNNFIV